MEGSSRCAPLCTYVLGLRTGQCRSRPSVRVEHAWQQRSLRLRAPASLCSCQCRGLAEDCCWLHVPVLTGCPIPLGPSHVCDEPSTASGTQQALNKCVPPF